MNINAAKAEKGNVSYETPEGTVVHININQRSALDCLLDTFRYFRDMKKSGQKTKPSSAPGSAAHLGFGVAYISLGLVSVMLAILICVVRPGIAIYYAGIHFWVGFPFLVSGILNVVAYKLPNKYWIALAFISVLVNFSVSIAGMVLTVNDIQRFYWFDDTQVCYNLRNGRGYYNGGTNAPRYGYESEYDLRRCLDGMQNYKNVVQGLVIMTLLMMIWGLCLSILNVGSRVKSFCCSCKLDSSSEDKDDSLLTPNLSDHIIIA
ncbi:transmembrane protein 176A [Rhinoderma darwinii]|uniref:transmembrane protein 176A n=1 Tax=Rhinoderma darwinii TaxID=43563 RepID=UPI003F66EDD1